jgi:hypothetical protein
VRGFLILDFRFLIDGSVSKNRSRVGASLPPISDGLIDPRIARQARSEPIQNPKSKI